MEVFGREILPRLPSKSLGYPRSNGVNKNISPCTENGTRPRAVVGHRLNNQLLGSNSRSGILGLKDGDSNRPLF